MKINLGGGKLKIEGFLNVDLCDGADIVHDLDKPLPFKDGEVDEIMAIHVIESFWKWQFIRILKDWKRVLNGKLTVEFTDLDSTIQMYLSNSRLDKIFGKWGLYGNQDIICDPISYHHYVWTKDELKQELELAGFTNIEFSKDNILHHSRRDWRIICQSGKIKN